MTIVSEILCHVASTVRSAAQTQHFASCVGVKTCRFMTLITMSQVAQIKSTLLCESKQSESQSIHKGQQGQGKRRTFVVNTF